MQFEYKVRDRQGRTQEGLLAAADERSAAKALREQGHYVMSIAPVTTPRDTFQWRLIGYALNPLSPQTLAAFYRMLESSLRAGFTVTEALSRIERDLPSSRLRQSLRGVAGRVAGGESLTAALEHEPAHFPAYVRQCLRSGEANGCLEEMVGEVANAYEVDARVSRSLRWPTWLLLGTVLPAPVLWRFFRLIEYFAHAVMEQPTEAGAAWRAALGQWLSQDAAAAALLTLAVVLVLAAGKVVIRYPGALPWRDAMVLKLPHWGGLARDAIRLRMLRTLHAAYRAGQPLAEAVAMAASASGNGVFSQRLLEQVDVVRQGRKLSDALRSAQVLPAQTVGVLANAEETGQLQEALHRAAEQLGHEQESTLRGALVRSWTAAVFASMVIPAGIFVHVVMQYYRFAFDFADSMMP